MLYLPIIFSIFFIELLRNKKTKVDTLSIFHFIFLQSYLIPLILWGFLPEEFSDTPYFLNYNASECIETLLVIHLSYFAFILSYLILSRVRFKYSLSFVEFSRLNNKFIFNKLMFIIILFILVVLFNVVYTGGVKEYLIAGNEARHNKISFGISGYLNYILSGALFVIISIIFIAVEYKKKLINCFLFICIIILFIGVLSTGGRGSLVSIFVFSVIYLYSQGYLKVNVKFYVISLLFFIASLFIIFFLRKISSNLMSGQFVFEGIEISVFFNDFVSILIYPFKYFVHYIYIIPEFFNNPELYNYPRMGMDILSGFILMIPGYSGLDFGLFELPDIISQDVLGKYNGYIPPGWIGWSLIDGGLFFLTLKIFWSAFFCVFLDKSYQHVATGTLGKTIYFLIVFMMLEFLFQGTAMNLFRGSIGLYLFLYFLLFLPFVRVGRLRIIRTNKCI